MGLFDIQYKLRTFIKGQVLADFIVEFTLRHPKILRIGGNKQGSPQKSATWKVCMDGASNYKGTGVGTVLVSHKGIRLEKSFKWGF